MAIKGFKALLKDKDLNHIYPVTKTESVYIADGETTVDDATLDTLSAVESNTASKKFAGALALKEAVANFRSGCSAIAAAITAGRDGQGTGGVSTASDASLSTMTANITTLASQNYTQGANSVKVTRNLALSTTAGTGSQSVDITDNWYTTATIDRTAAYNAGVASVKTARTLTVPTTRGSAVNITDNWYTLVDNTACYDAGMAAGSTVHTATKTLTSSNTGTTDMGASHSYRYVNAANVYSAGKTAGRGLNYIGETNIGELKGGTVTAPSAISDGLLVIVYGSYEGVTPSDVFGNPSSGTSTEAVDRHYLGTHSGCGISIRRIQNVTSGSSVTYGTCNMTAAKALWLSFT